MKKVLVKESMMEIKVSRKRFISILLIVMLGVGFFAGIKATSPDMKKTIDKYMKKTDMYDINVLSTLGITNDDIQAIKNVNGVSSVEGGYNEEAIIKTGENEDTVVIHNITTKMNKVVLVQGKMPESINECLVEKTFIEKYNLKIGEKISVIEESIEGFLKNKELKIVGVVNSPLYISTSRGYARLGTGTINYFVYVLSSNIDSDVYSQVYIKIKDSKNLMCYSNKYKNVVSQVKDNVEKIKESRIEARYSEVLSDANKKLKEAEDKLQSETKKVNTKISNAEKKIAYSKNKIVAAQQQISKSKLEVGKEFSEAENKLESSKQELNEQEKNLNLGKTKLSEAKENLENLKEINSNYNNVTENIAQVTENIKAIDTQISTLDPVNDADYIKELNIEKSTFQTTLATLNVKKDQIENLASESGIDLSSIGTLISTTEQGIVEKEKKISYAEEEINKAKQEIEAAETKLENTKITTYANIKIAENKIKESLIKIAKAEKELDEAKKKAAEELTKANNKILDAKDDISKIKKPTWYILDRESNMGYSGFMQDTDRIAKIGRVFPIVFFVVAALISLTSMTRMVDEQRIQIGTLKAMGYTKFQIASKYIIYSLLATVLGGIIGTIIGFNFLPNTIYNMYSMMYNVTGLVVEYNMYYATTGMLAATICTVGATILVIIKDLKEVPAELMRPKAPKSGKRVLLEKMPFIWSKLSFTKKVTIRNIFRYKKRFFMTVIGVMGCTSLIVAGFGLRDSISNMIPSQFGKVFKYNMVVTFKDSVSNDEINKKMKQILKMEQVQSGINVNIESGKLKNNNLEQDAQIVVTKDNDELKDYVQLRDRVTGKTYDLGNNSVVITEKVAKLLNIKVGDKIKLINSNDEEVEIKVVHITENYLLHYVYMSDKLYEKIYGVYPQMNTLLMKNKNITNAQEEQMGSEILKDNGTISSLSFVSSTKNIYIDVMNNLNFVVWVLIISAGLLDFVVLYNLAYVNIGERLRELATIKVLGFYDKEVHSYIEKETIILTIIGIIIGLVVGYFLNIFIMGTCELDMHMFDKRIHIQSYIYSAIITGIFTAFVSIVTYFSLKKINMIEALKSIE